MDLTQEQLRVVELLVTDMSIDAIARELNSHTWLINRRIERIYRKLGIHRRQQLREWYAEQDTLRIQETE